MTNDKTETNNLAKKRPDVVKKMESLYSQWWESL
jgi:hypothetical protein